jgi:hypothetical protein
VTAAAILVVLAVMDVVVYRAPQIEPAIAFVLLRRRPRVSKP